MAQPRELPVYLFTGFLEAGKTKFILETMHDPNFNDGKSKYLILCCEEGEEEYEAGEFGENVTLNYFEKEELLTEDRISALIKRAKADVVVIEYNGMWQLDSLYRSLPEYCMVYKEILIVDSTTFDNYNANMRSLVVDKLQSAEIVVFNRTTERTDRLSLHKIVRGVSRKANICYEDMSGNIEFDDIQDPLPYDINAPVIVINDEDFAIFYRDMNEEFEKYNGKTVRFKGICALDSALPKGQYAIGRHIMICCADDISYRGVVAKGMGSLTIKTRDWAVVEGVLSIEHSPLYQGEGPVLTVKRIERAEKPQEEVCTLY